MDRTLPPMDTGRAPAGTRCAEAAVDPGWDARVEAAPGGDLAQTTLWAASRRQLGFRTWHITVRDDHGTLLGGCLMYAKRLPPGVWVASIPRGPVLFVDGPRAAAAVEHAVIAQARALGIHFLVVQPPEGADALERAFAGDGFRPGVPSIAPEATLRLDLGRSDEELLAGMNSMRRRNVRKALRAGFEMAEESDVAVFHRLHVATAERQGFVPIGLENLQAQYDALAARSMCTMLIARHGGVPLAGLWLTRFAGTVTFKLAGWDAGGQGPSHANELLHWTAMQRARAQGAHTYDLGGFDRRSAELIVAGKPLPEGFQQSPSFFKLGFGGTPVLFPRARFLFTQRLANLMLGSATQRVFTTPGALRFVQRLRNG